MYSGQRANKVVSESPGLADFAIGLVDSVLNLSNGQVKYFEEFSVQKKCKNNKIRIMLLIKKFWGLVEMMFGLVNANFILPDWQAVKNNDFLCTLNLVLLYTRIGY